MRFVTHSADETRALAAEFGALLEPGDVVVLGGEMGSGKTTFAQGLAVGLGVTEPVTSPSFTIVQEYDGRVPVAHVDVYRLDRMQDLHDIGFDEIVDSGRVTLVEWGDVVDRALPPDRLAVRLGAPRRNPAEDDREVEVHAHGPSWNARQDRLAECG